MERLVFHACGRLRIYFIILSLSQGGLCIWENPGTGLRPGRSLLSSIVCRVRSSGSPVSSFGHSESEVGWESVNCSPLSSQQRTVFFPRALCPCFLLQWSLPLLKIFFPPTVFEELVHIHEKWEVIWPQGSHRNLAYVSILLIFGFQTQGGNCSSDFISSLPKAHSWPALWISNLPAPTIAMNSTPLAKAFTTRMLVTDPELWTPLKAALLVQVPSPCHESAWGTEVGCWKAQEKGHPCRAEQPPSRGQCHICSRADCCAHNRTVSVSRTTPQTGVSEGSPTHGYSETSSTQDRPQHFYILIYIYWFHKEIWE